MSFEKKFSPENISAEEVSLESQTPFEVSNQEKRAFASGKLFTTSSILESASPLQK